MDELTRITHSPAGYTVTTGYGLFLAQGATRGAALTALFHRGLTPEQAVTAVNAATRLGRITVAGLSAA